MIIIPFEKTRVVSASFWLGSNRMSFCKELRLHLQIKRAYSCNTSNVVRLMRPVNLPTPHLFDPLGQ